MLCLRRGALLDPWKRLIRIGARHPGKVGYFARPGPVNLLTSGPTARYFASDYNDYNIIAEGRDLHTPISHVEGRDDEEHNRTTLRPYQESAVSACLSALSSGLTRIGVSSPTGSGKTTMFMSLIPRIEATDQRSRVLILVGSVELANQAENAAKRILGDSWRVEVEQGKRQASGTADM